MEHRVQADISAPVAYGHFARECPKKVLYAALSTAIPVTTIPVPPAPASSTTLTPEMKISTQPWYFYFGASNHMTNNLGSLSNVRKYDGNLHINTIDGSSLHISVVGDLSPSLVDVFVSLDLLTNLLYVGQLVDKNCNVQFSRSGCVVQDEASGKVITKEPKLGWLFPLKVFLSTFIPSSPIIFFACNVIGFGTKMWHRHLGHPKSDVLRIMFKSSILGSQDCTSLDTYFD
ncbi:uncharacterized protein [Aristolochia californica]|uniref:uncharacterized protein n=1 Tax=Aristolochia californica TaxID=171875 RepID=UPI0035D5EA45